MVIAAALALAASIAGASSPTRCADPLGTDQTARLATTATHNVDTRDLLELRSFGPQGAGSEDDAPFALSPDHRQAALLLRRADPETNSFCQSLVVVDLASGRSRVIDRGGALIRVTYAHGGIRAGFPSGFPAVITPAWSPDGQSIAYLKSVDGPAQIWIVPVSGGAPAQVTHEPQDVTEVTWSPDAGTLLFRTDRALTAALAAIDVEGLSGWHYDDRAYPNNRAKPFPLPSDPTTLDHALDLATGSISNATQVQRDLLAQADGADRLTTTLSDGSTATLRATFHGTPGFSSDHVLEVAANGEVARCMSAPCTRSRAFWLAGDGRSVLILARSGWGNGDQTFYRWSPRTGRVDRLSTTRDVLIGCRPLGKTMLCAREGSTTPRRLAIVDPTSGATRTVFNPNPDYDRLRTGKVDRIDVTSANGSRAFADIMLPTDFVAGRRYPMVIVNYESRGFLSGGTNNEFPIPPMASAGMIVLSFNRPVDVFQTAAHPAKTFIDAVKLNVDHWADRRNVHSALMAAVDQVEARGIVDTGRVGITGLSDGLATTAFALLNSNRFSVAALAACCEEPIEAEVLQGPSFADQMIAAGYPTIDKPDPDFWKDYSLAQNAARVHAPILIQAADTESILSLPTYEALREAGVPVDLYVFGEEHHSKWQPAHRLAVWDRAIRWFQFWFGLPPVKGEPPFPSAELARWRGWQEHWQPTLSNQP